MQTQPLSKPARSSAEVEQRPAALRQQGKQLFEALTFFGRRLAFGMLGLLALIYLTHLGLDMARGTSFAVALSQALTKSLAYVAHILQGDLGLAAAGTITGNPTPVVEVVPELILNSLGLLAVSLLLATLIGIVLGFLATQYRRSNGSAAIIALSVIGISTPSFFAAPLLQMLMIQWTHYFGAPLLPLGGFGWDERIILPALVLAARPTAQITRVTFVTLGEVMGQDFVRVASSKGLRPYLILLHHIAPNVAIPILTTVGLSLRFSLSSLPVVEFFFGWTGLGFVLLKAIAGQDDNLTVALILCLGILFILVNLLLEATYRRLDPRLRKAKPRVGRGQQAPLAVRLKDFLTDWVAILADNPLNRWLKRRQTTSHVDRSAAEAGQSPAETISQTGQSEATSRLGRSAAETVSRGAAPRKTKTSTSTSADHPIRTARRRAFLRGTFGNVSFLLGGLIVLALLLVVFFGPALSPHSPYTTQGLKIENNEVIVPPFPPGETYPWGTDILGRDLMSLILTGAQQTLLLAAVVVLARLLLGFVLGVLAGWWSESWLDRLLLSLAEIIAAFPTLLLTMILIVAIGIRQGLQPFIIAFCFVGWAEIMQFVRGQVMVLRPKPFIESAIAIGLRPPRLIMGHILPNLMPALISLAALEMGAVLILLGELGFIGIFIGGGALAEVGSGIGAYHYSDIPEWGALLSNIRAFARSYPWTAIYPVSVFFLAILGFNLFGEGLRRLIDTVGLGFANWFNRYTIAIALLALLGFNWMQQNSGPVLFYRQHAHLFEGQQALVHVQQLTAPDLMGRALGTPGLDTAAAYIATQFEALGLQPAGQKRTFFYERKRTFETLTSLPQFTLTDGGPQPLYLQDFSTFPMLFRNIGQAAGQVRFITTGPLAGSQTFGGTTFPALRGLDYRDEILLVLSARDAAVLRRIPHAGILVVAEDATRLQRNYTLLNRDPLLTSFGRQHGQDSPVLWLTEAVAERLLQGSGYTLAELRLRAEGLVENQFIDLPTPNTAALTVEGIVEDKATVPHVLGYLPGVAGVTERTGLLDSQMIIVVAQYDSPPPNPDGHPRPNANHNASGVAVLLETIRAIQESDYQPFRSFLFVAYTAEGLEGGEVVTTPDPGKLLQARQGFNNFEVEAVVQVHDLGAGAGEGLALSTGGSRRLANVFETAARQAGVQTTRVDEPVDLRLVFDDTVFQGGQEAPHIGLSWQGWQAMAGTPEDTPERISAEKLEQAGQTLSLALMIMGRETEY